MKFSLTPRQDEAYRFLRTYMKERQMAPTLAEIMRAMGWSSKSQVHGVLTALEERGYIMRQFARRRSITLVPDLADEVRSLRQIRDAVGVYIDVQERFRTAYDQNASAPDTIEKSTQVTTALQRIKELVREVV